MITGAITVVAYKRNAFQWWSEPFKDSQLLGTLIPAAADNAPAASVAFEAHWAAQTVQFLANHRVGRTALAPGTLFLETARQACGAHLAVPDAGRGGTGGCVALHGIQFTEMLFLGVGAERPRVRTEVVKATGRITIMSSQSEDTAAGHEEATSTCDVQTAGGEAEATCSVRTAGGQAEAASSAHSASGHA